MKKIFAFFLLPLCLLAACRSKKAVTPSPQYETKTFERSDKPCNAQKDNCSYLSFKYVEFTQAPTPAGKDVLNQTVKNFLLEPIFEKKSENFEEVAKDFFAENQKQLKEFPASPPNWYVEKNATVGFQSPQVVNLSLERSEYLGGAHPNSYLTYVNLDPSTGKVIALSDLFTSGYEEKLEAIAEKKFRERHQIAPQANLNEAGFFFKDGKFSLNNNFSIGAKELTFYYNAYEIAPYVMGPVKLPMDYSEIQAILKPGGIVPPKN